MLGITGINIYSFIKAEFAALAIGTIRYFFGLVIRQANISVKRI